MAAMDCNAEPDILSAISKMMTQIYAPSVQAIGDWGDLDANPQVICTVSKHVFPRGHNRCGKT